MIASAAAGNSNPLSSTSLSSAGPSPGRGARPLVFTKIPTTTGSPARRAIVTHVRGRRSSLEISTRITDGSSPDVIVPRALEEHVLEGPALDDELAHADLGG